jgi:hypothetical protein
MGGEHWFTQELCRRSGSRGLTMCCIERETDKVPSSNIIAGVGELCR